MCTPINENGYWSDSSSAEEKKCPQNQEFLNTLTNFQERVTLGSNQYKRLTGNLLIADKLLQFILSSDSVRVSQMQPLGLSANETTPQNNSVTPEKTSEKKFAWGQTTADTSEKKSAWGQTTTDSSEKKFAWGQTTADTSEKKSAWGQTTTDSSEKKFAWGQTTADTSEKKFPWSRTTADISEKKSAWGQTTTDSSEKKFPWSRTTADISEKKSAWGQTTADTSEKKFPWSRTTADTSEKNDQKDHPVENNSSASNADHDDQHNPWCTAGKDGRQNFSNYNRSEGNKQPRTGQYNSQDSKKIRCLHEKIERLKTSIEKKPKDPDLNARIAKLYSKVGNSEMAMHHNRIGHESGDPSCSLFFAMALRKKEDENSLKKGSLILKNLLDEKLLKTLFFIDLAQIELLLIYIQRKDFEQALPLANKIIDGNTSKSAKKEADNKTLLLAEYVKTAFNIKLDRLDRLDRQQATSPLNTNANNQQTQDDGTKKNRCSKEDTYRFMREPKSWLFFKLFDPDEAIGILEKLIPEYDDPQLYLKLRDAYKKKDNDNLTIYYSELAFKDSNYIISKIKYAQNLMMKGDNEEAKQILQATLSKKEIKNMHSEKYLAQEQLMKCHYVMGEHEEALKLAKGVICTYKQQREQDIRPYISAACTNITSLLRLNRPWKQEADELYAQYPNNYIVLATLTQAYIEDGNTKKARELIGHFYKTINIETVDNNVAKENRIIRFNLKEAKCYECQTDLDDAEAIYKRLLNKYPNSFKIVYAYSEFLQHSRNNLDKAEEILKTLRNEPEQISDNLLLEERILKCQGKQMPMSKEVFDSAKKLSERFQNNPDITYATASIYFNAFLLTNQNILLEKAREQAEISDKLKSNNAKCIRLLAHIYRLVGLENIAKQCWNRAATLDNKHGDNRLNEQQKSWKELEAQRRKRKYPEKTCTQTIKNFSSLKEYLKNEGKEQNEESSSPSEVFTQVELFQNDNPIIKGKYKQF